jgi:hypothetical protein
VLRAVAALLVSVWLACANGSSNWAARYTSNRTTAAQRSEPRFRSPDHLSELPRYRLGE